MIDYIEKKQTGVVMIVTKKKTILYDEPLTRVLQRYAQRELTSIGARIKATKQQFNLQSKVPIYLGKDLLLIPIKSLRSPQALLVNFYAIRSYHNCSEGELKLVFNDAVQIIIGCKASFRRQMMHCRTIDLFMSECQSK
ncbi:MAG: competence protein ComK [Candidatus Izemoplasmatales bacterium]|jgi:hypothetical protein|nr:competence protein ComK [Candidatus Izemoplasmatales bacterium]